MINRIQIVKRQLKKYNLDAFLISDLINIRYLSGFTGSNALLLITKSNGYLLTDFRYEEQVKREVRDCKLIITNNGLYQELFRNKLIETKTNVGFEALNLSYSLYKGLKKLFKDSKFIPFNSFVEDLEIIKDKNEIQNTTNAVKISDFVFKDIVSIIKPGLRELDVAAELSYKLKLYGSEGDAFDTIVASGKNSSMPHSKPTMRKIKNRDIVLMDFGAVVNGYRSDMTRIVFVGNPTNEMKKIYDVVLNAQNVALENARERLYASDLDALSRDYIAKSGYRKYFMHSLGHGLGLKIHQKPSISPLSKEILQENMIITIEPGIYLPGKFGVRIEDNIVIKKNSSINLTKSTKELIII